MIAPDASQPILMPKLGLTMMEGTLSSWRVAPGQAVKAGDVLFVVETDKVTNDVEAAGDGIVRSLVSPEGSTVSVGTVVAMWSPTDPITPIRQEAPTRRVATPLARRIARAAGLDVAAVTGSGPRGRIKASDVHAHLANAAPVSSSRAIARRAATSFEKTLARRVTDSKQMIPHFYVQADADVTRLLELRTELNAAENAPHLTLTHFITAAVARALAADPDLNVIWDNDSVIVLPNVDVGIAVATERGLLVPIMRNVSASPLDTIARDTDALVRRAREGLLTTNDLDGGAVSISNVGMHGAAYLTPIINHGQAAMLGVAAIRPVFRPNQAGQPVLRQELGLVLSCDHRVIDGVRAARFLDHVCVFLAQPLTLLRTP